MTSGPGAVIYICSEGTAHSKTASGLGTHRGVSADDAPFYLFEETINFMNVEDIFTLLATVEDIAARSKDRSPRCLSIRFRRCCLAPRKMPRRT